MTRRPVVTLTTDFGNASTWVAQMKGVILGLAPETILVDMTHDVPPHDIAAAAYLLETGVEAFPRSSVHVAVVDPGVGTSRRPVVVRTEPFVLVGPDNGIFTRVLRRFPLRGAWVLEASHYRSDTVSPTFEGRDVFAPAAAWLARGTDPDRFGPPVQELVALPPSPTPPPNPSPFRATVVHVDRFGNAVLDVPVASLAGWNHPHAGLPRLQAVTSSGMKVSEIRAAFGNGPADTPFLISNSSGYLEIAVREGSAAALLALHAGDEVEINPAP
jgi:S-adenosylmethionine hydrolase